MNYINERLLNDHQAVVTNINKCIEDCKDSPEGELFKLMVQHPEHLYSVFGKSYNDITSIYYLILSLDNWITDDGEYCITRKINEKVTRIREEVYYDYQVTSGYEGGYITAEDIIYLLKASIEVNAFYEQNKDCIEGFDENGNRLSYLERLNNPCYKACYKEWRELDKKVYKYLEKKYLEDQFYEDD